jgi:general secretion pathway protein L
MSQVAMIAALLFRPTAAAGQFLRRAVTWWLDELSGMVPGTLRHSFDHVFGRVFGDAASDAAELDLAGGRAFLLLRERGRAVPLSVPLEEAPAAARHRVAALLRRHGTGNATTIRLDPGRLFITTLDLPRAAERSLEAVLRHQVEHLIPLPPTQLCFAHRMLPRPANAATLRVAVAVAKRASLDKALALARELGLLPRRVVAEINEAGPTLLTLWQANRVSTVTPVRRRLFRMLEAAALALAVAAYGLHIHHLNQLRDTLQAAIAQSRQQAAGTRDLAHRVTQSAEALAFLRARRDAPAPLWVLDRLTTLLPSDTWVSDLTLRGRDVEIVGFAPHAADLIGLIEGSPVFAQARFRSPITLLPDEHAERFDLTLAVKTP